jgi:hypothetical protein
MKPFAKLSARQWEVLVGLVREAAHDWLLSQPQVSRWDYATESERVASLRACASLVRRGLIARVEREGWRSRFKLAVLPRVVLNAVVDGDVKSVDVGYLRCLVKRAEWFAHHPVIVDNRQRKEPPSTGWGRESACRGVVTGGLMLAMSEGSIEPVKRILEVLEGTYSRGQIILAIDELKRSGAWDRIASEPPVPFR